MIQFGPDRGYVRIFVIYKKVSSGKRVFFGRIYYVLSKYTMSVHDYSRLIHGTYTSEEFVFEQLKCRVAPLYDN